ncbi:MAG: thiamine-phosphate kinase [Planctomycetaceae bacterium]
MLPDKSPEFRFIEQIRRLTGPTPGVVLGIGDDAAAVTFESGQPAVITSDMLLEGVHFEFPQTSPRNVGRKAINVNFSDLAAMAAAPRFAVVSVCLPADPSGTSPVGPQLMEGILEATHAAGAAVIGGDTNAWDGPLIVSITAIGEAHPKGLVKRNGARVGDWICVTGDLGGSLEGKHLAFTPRITEAAFLHESVALNAMLDISDGLVADLYHILEESACGAILDARAIPISAAATATGTEARTPLQRALGDGEDFELLFTLRAEEADRLLARQDLPVRLSHIGTIVSEPGCQLREANALTDLPRLGWSHDL